jgi:hypothetical protein
LNAVERVRDTEKIVERAIHRATTRATCTNQRSIDVEENDRQNQDSERTLPARGPFGDDSSSKETRCPSAS